MTERVNRLAGEKSPYLQQHAHNPVDWYPWGPEAFAAAKSQDKPIFLSIGYSTCHWCHVMAHESFENADIAALMNDSFINIKVDREERPDVDAIYMSAVQALTGSGGWPMSVWLTPELKPFYGGTYFPPEDRYGRPGFPTVLVQLAEIYKSDRERIATASTEIAGVIEQAANAAFRTSPDLPPVKTAMDGAFASLSAAFDPAAGGFSPAPKFPMPVYLEYLLHHHARTGEARALQMAAHSFRKMAEGGIYDQLGGGFSRYSTDDRWLVPHFEKMLYDNAQLLRAAGPLWAATGDAFFRRVALETADYLVRDLRHPQGGFYSAEDADSEGKEGTFYLWTFAELKETLGAGADFAAALLGVSVNGNFMDPHTREAGKNVLSLAVPLREAATRHALSEDQAVAAWAEAKRRLFERRAKRVRPHRDEKILTEWNGLVISGLAKAGAALNEPRLVEWAAGAAQFIRDNLYDGATRRLYRRWRDGERAVDAQQTDYAMFIEGLLDLFEASGEARWLSFAAELAELQDARFFDPARGGYFMSAEAPDLLVRMKDDGDNVIPSGNSVAALNGLRLAALTGRDEFRQKSLGTLKAFAYSLAERPFTVAKMIPALDWEQSGHEQVAVVGPKDAAATRALLETARKAAPATRLVFWISPDGAADLGKLLPQFSSVKFSGGAAAAYVCRDFACRPPVSDAASLERVLAGAG